MKQRILSALMIFVLLISLIPIQTLADSFTVIGCGTAMVNYINVRSAPSDDCDVYNQLHKDDNVLITDITSDGRFYKIIYQGMPAYVAAYYMSFQKVGNLYLGSAGRANLAYDYVPLYSGPGESYEALRTYMKGTHVIIRGVHEDYLSVSIGDHYGFIHSSKITFSEDSSWEDVYMGIADLKIDPYYAINAWYFCMEMGLTEEGAAGLLGNLYAESGLRPNNLENWAEKYLKMTDDEYTAAIDNGSYTRDQFGDDYVGYGICQWTLGSRKENLYDFCQENNVSISDFLTQFKYLWVELDDPYYSPVRDVLLETHDIKEASDKFMRGFENPANQTNAARKERYRFAAAFYERFGKDGNAYFNDPGQNATVTAHHAFAYELEGFSKIITYYEKGTRLNVQYKDGDWCLLENGMWVQSEDITLDE